jgi:hypothetical protein
VEGPGIFADGDRAGQGFLDAALPAVMSSTPPRRVGPLLPPAERAGVRWGRHRSSTHLTLPIAAAMGPLPLPPRAGGEGSCH